MTPEQLAEIAGVQVAGADRAREALVRLEELHAAMSTTDRTAARNALAAWMGDPERLEDCVVLARVNPGAWTAWQVRAEGLAGMRQSIAALRRLVRDRSQPARLTLADEVETFDGPEVVPHGWQAPRGWAVRPDGVYRVTDDGEERVATRPVWVVGYLQDVDGHGYSVRIAWLQVDGSTGVRVVPAEHVADARALVGLASHGLPVNSTAARGLAVFIDAALEANSAIIKVEQTSGRMGWMPDGGFLLGSTYMGPGSVRLENDPGLAQVAGGYTPRGSWQGWLDEVVTPGAKSPMLWLAIYNAVASVLIEPLEMGDNWAIDRSGETSRGKSTVGRAAYSVWADPRSRPSWSTSLAGIEARAAILRSLPLSLDDSKKAKRGEDVAAVVYMHSGGVGKMRGKPGSGGRGVGLRATETWRSTLDSDGEQALTSFTHDAGARARVLVMRGAPLSDGDVARIIGLGCEAHFGHLGRRVVEYWTRGTPEDVADRRALWLGHWEDARTRWATILQPHGAVAGRLSRVVAALQVARMLCEEVGLPTPDCEPIMYAAECAKGGGQDADVPAAALRTIYELAVARPTSFWGRHEEGQDNEPRVPHQGWLGAWERGDGWAHLSVMSTQVTTWLERHGYDRGVIDRWAERGWLKVQASMGRRAKIRVDGSNVSVYCITREAVEAVMDQ